MRGVDPGSVDAAGDVLVAFVVRSECAHLYVETLSTFGSSFCLVALDRSI